MLQGPAVDESQIDLLEALYLLLLYVKWGHKLTRMLRLLCLSACPLVVGPTGVWELRKIPFAGGLGHLRTEISDLLTSGVVLLIVTVLQLPLRGQRVAYPKER